LPCKQKKKVQQKS